MKKVFRRTYEYAAHIAPDPDGGFLVTFPDVPEAITCGGDRQDAKQSAADALGLALRGYLAAGHSLPEPRTKARQEDLVVSPDAADALKLAVIETFQASGLSKAELARRLGKAETEAYRILDPDHPTKLSALEAALAVLGKKVVISVQDAA